MQSHKKAIRTLRELADRMDDPRIPAVTFEVEDAVSYTAGYVLRRIADGYERQVTARREKHEKKSFGRAP